MFHTHTHKRDQHVALFASFLLQEPTPLAKLVAPASGRTCTTTPTSTEPSQEQGSQLVLEPQGQVTTIWHLLTFKPQPYSRTTTTRILSATRGFCTPTRSSSTVELLMLKSNLTLLVARARSSPIL